MSEERKELCGSCRFFENDTIVEELEPGYGIRGFCRRYAPKPVLTSLGNKQNRDNDLLPSPFAYWPSVEDDDWCGEWQASENPQ